MNSEFYVWTHAYDVSGITSIVLKIRKDNDGMNSMASHVNEVYDPAAVGLNASEVGSWISIPMTKRILPSTASALTAAANNSQIQYFSQAVSPVVADYYFAKITDANVPTFRGKLLDYYIEATDARGNLSKSDIQHVFVVDDGAVLVPPSAPTVLTATAASSAQINLTWSASSGATSYTILRNGAVVGTTSTLAYADTGLLAQTTYTYTIQAANAYGDSTASPSAVATTPPMTMPKSTPPLPRD
ncbi:MAG: fibronectin type III domain-containing protein [Verrucomicrobia bacterium]|nr:fibronectin type III domain-containing protein [Verrucomicrobiota bacterium]